MVGRQSERFVDFEAGQVGEVQRVIFVVATPLGFRVITPAGREDIGRGLCLTTTATTATTTTATATNKNLWVYRSIGIKLQPIGKC